MLTLNFVLVLLCTLSVTGSEYMDAPWCYDYAINNNVQGNKASGFGPSEWFKVAPACAGKSQSPIDIEFGNTEFDGKLQTIEIVKTSKSPSRYNTDFETWKMTNNGFGVKLIPMDTDFEFTAQPNNEKFKMKNMHFHWRGSEHFVDNRRFSGEVHLVHQSARNPEKFSVIGFLIDLATEDNYDMSPFIDELYRVREVESSTLLEGTFRLQDMIPFKITDFFRYSGSLTTPECNEGIEWNLVDSPVLTMSDLQIVRFQSLKDKDGNSILANARPIQDLNRRVVARSFKPNHSGSRKQIVLRKFTSYSNY